MITIGKPNVILKNGYAFLENDINVDGENHKLFYQVDEKYSSFLTSELADAFLISVLPFAMMFKHDITIVDSFISESLYDRLLNEYIPCLSKYSGIFKHISINCLRSNLVFNPKFVGTGVSCGVDSFYTILKNLNNGVPSKKLTHLCFFNVGSNGYGKSAEDNAEDRFNKRCIEAEKIAKELNLEFLAVNTNLYSFYPVNYNWIHSFKTLSVVLSLQKMFKRYLCASSWSLNDFNLDYHDSAFYDLFTTTTFSNQNVQIELSATWESRLEKVAFISNFPIVQKNLNVCNNFDFNCSICDKCLRTIGELYAIGKLDFFRESFDVDYFYKNKRKCFSRIIAKQYDGTIESKFNKEIIKATKNNKKKIPPFSRIAAIPLIIKNLLIKSLKKSKFATKLYRKKLMKKEGYFYPEID